MYFKNNANNNLILSDNKNLKNDNAVSCIRIFYVNIQKKRFRYERNYFTDNLKYFIKDFGIENGKSRKFNNTTFRMR